MVLYTEVKGLSFVCSTSEGCCPYPPVEHTKLRSCTSAVEHRYFLPQTTIILWLSDVYQAPFRPKVLSSPLHSPGNLPDLFFQFFHPPEHPSALNPEFPAARGRFLVMLGIEALEVLWMIRVGFRLCFTGMLLLPGWPQL